MLHDPEGKKSMRRLKHLLVGGPKAGLWFFALSVEEGEKNGAAYRNRTDT